MQCLDTFPYINLFNFANAPKSADCAQPRFDGGVHLDVVAVAVGVGEGLAAHVAPVAAVDAALGF